MSAPSALERLSAWPRLRLAALPTPLVRAPRLGAELGIADLHVKMDAETGFALGGNKVRKLEMELEPGRLSGVTCLVTAGGPQSNHCRVTAAAGARLGLRCVLVVNGPEPRPPTGNALLQRLFGAEIRLVPERADREPTMQVVADEVAARGGRALVVPIGASTGLGCLGYAAAAVELVDQLDALGPAAGGTTIVVATSSCGTLAGLALGLALAGRRDVRLVGVSADASAAEIHERTRRIAAEGAALLGWKSDLPDDAFTAIDDQVGDGYGIPTPASTAAISLFARTEGIVLDPTYTAKAAAGLVAMAEGAGAPDGERVVFLHTGGHPALLAGSG